MVGAAARTGEQAEKLGARYEEALTRLEMGKRLNDRIQLDLAEAALADMGAECDLSEARRLIGHEAAPLTGIGDDVKTRG